MRRLERMAPALAIACLGLLAATASAARVPASGSSSRGAPPVRGGNGRGAPHVRGLDVCRRGPRCDYGAAYESFPTWGNVAPESAGDCTFAAAADWEQIVLGVHPGPTVIREEFTRAGGSKQSGLAQSALWSYWQHDGIAGVRLAAVRDYTTDRADVEGSVRTYAAMFVELSFSSDDHIAQYVSSDGLHDLVVDGFTPEGPLVVSWGQTLQMTWAQWNREALGMWGITTS
jgi:hypothetical protein